MKFKKPLFLGSLFVVATPLVTIIACSNSSDDQDKQENDQENKDDQAANDNKTETVDDNQSTNQKSQEEILKEKVQSLKEDSLQGITINSKVKANSLTDQEIKDALQAISGLAKLDLSKVTISKDNQADSVAIKITNYGADKIISLKGFKKIIATKVQSLEAKDFNSIINASKLPSEVTKEDIKKR